MTEEKNVPVTSAIDKIGRMVVVPSILELICKTTGMGFATVARVTADQWVACAVRDEVQFGLLPGGELKLDTTICHEIRQRGQGVIIDNVSEDPYYRDHHTPKMYGLQSYISIPIITNDGAFFGTLCAIDPNATILNTPDIIGMFKAYADLISFLLQPSNNETDLTAIDKMAKDKVNEQLNEVNARLSANGDIPRSKKSTHFKEVLNNAADSMRKLLTDLKTTT